MNQRNRLAGMLIVAFFAHPLWVAAQENPYPELKARGEQPVFFAQSLQTVLDDIDQLAVSARLPFRGITDGFLQVPDASPLDVQKPIVVYGTDPAAVVWTPKSEEIFKRITEAGPTNFPYDENAFPSLLQFSQWEPVFGASSGQSFVHGFDQQSVSEVANAKPLWSQLSPRFQRMFRDSGIVLHIGFGVDDEPAVVFEPDDFPSYSADQRETIRLVNEMVASADRIAMGLKFKDQCLSVEAVWNIQAAETAEKIFDFAAIQKPFRHTIGLPAQDLLVAASVQGESFRSPEFVTILPRLLGQIDQSLQKAGDWEDAWGLIGDSWFEVKSSRVGVYRKPGRNAFSLISILDPREPDKFVDQIRSMVDLVPPPANLGNDGLSKEVATLIQDLSSPKFSIRERAYRRLLVVGEPAIPQLQKTVDAPASAEARRLATRALQKISAGSNPNASRQQPDSVDFWRELKPRLSLTRNVQYGPHTVDLLRIHDDPRLSPLAQTALSERMLGLFGPRWREIPLQRVDDRYIVMLGSDMELFQNAVNLLSTQRDPISQICATQNRRAASGQARIYLNTPRLHNAKLNPFLFLQGGGWKQPETIPETDALTMVNLKVARDFLELALYWPSEEIHSNLADLWGF